MASIVISYDAERDAVLVSVATEVASEHTAPMEEGAEEEGLLALHVAKSLLEDRRRDSTPPAKAMDGEKEKNMLAKPAVAKPMAATPAAVKPPIAKPVAQSKTLMTAVNKMPTSTATAVSSSNRASELSYEPRTPVANP